MYRWLERVLVSRILRRSRLAQALFKVPKWLYRTPLRRAMEPHVLLLTTSGRRSGDPHTVAVDYLTIDGADYVVAGWGGDSDWCRNLRADASTSVEIGKDLTDRRAVELDHAERRDVYAEIRTRIGGLADFVGDDDPVFRLDRI